MDSLPTLLVTLPAPHQTLLLALTCEKMRASIAAYDEQEDQKGSPLFEEAFTALFALSLGKSVAATVYTHLTDRLNAFWPDLEESTNTFASYAFDACVALSEALCLCARWRDDACVAIPDGRHGYGRYVRAGYPGLRLGTSGVECLPEQTSVMQRERQR
jgi:uncharacterized protein YjaG (DUF416 family)